MKLCECKCGYGLCANIDVTGWSLKYITVKLPGVGKLLIAENKVNGVGVNIGKQLYNREVDGGTVRIPTDASADTELLFRFRSALLDVWLDFTTCLAKGYTIDLVEQLRVAKSSRFYE